MQTFHRAQNSRFVFAAAVLAAMLFGAFFGIGTDANAAKLKNGAYVRNAVEIPQPNNPGFFWTTDANIGFIVTNGGKIRSGGGFMQFKKNNNVCTSKQVGAYGTVVTDPDTAQQETVTTLGVNFAPKKAVKPNKKNGSFKVKAVKSQYYPSLTATAYGKLKKSKLASFTIQAGVNGQIVKNGTTKNVRCKAKQTFNKAAWTSDKGIASETKVSRLIRSFP
ncbi:MAG: hypothetical protein WBW62_07315 [Solirubrobacterales bacterium]